MIKVLLWATGGFGLAVICGLMGLAYLSASIVTLTVFCATPAILIHLSAWCFSFVWLLPDRVASWLHPSGAVTRLGEECDR